MFGRFWVHVFGVSGFGVRGSRFRVPSEAQGTVARISSRTNVNVNMNTNGEVRTEKCERLGSVGYFELVFANDNRLIGAAKNQRVVVRTLQLMHWNQEQE
jgi:hypothetical protein